LFGWVFRFHPALFLVTKAKPYYLAPAFVFLFAGGAVAIADFVRRRNWNWLRRASIVLLLAGGAMTAPFVLPVLPVESFMKYRRGWGSRRRGKKGGKRRNCRNNMPTCWLAEHGQPPSQGL